MKKILTILLYVLCLAYTISFIGIFPADIAILIILLTLIGTISSILYSKKGKDFLDYLEEKYPEKRKELGKNFNMIVFMGIAKSEWFQSIDDETLKNKGNEFKNSFKFLIINATISGLILILAIFFKAGIIPSII